MLTRSTRTFALGCALALAPVPVLAAPAAKPTQPEAQQLLQEGVAAYEAGEYGEAIEKLQEGYEIEPALAFLYTWAQAERQRGDCKAAIKLYQQIVDSEHETLTRYANAGIVECARVLAEEDEEPDEPVPSTLEDEPAEVEDEPLPIEEGESEPAPATRKDRSWYQDPLAASLVAVGVVGVGVGTGLLVKAEIDAKRNENQEPDPGDDTLDYGEFSARADRIETFRIAGGVVAGVGGALLIGGAVRWAVLGVREKRNTNVAVTWGRDFTGLTLSGRF